MVTQGPGWDREDVKAALRKKGYTQESIAREVGVCLRTVNLTIKDGRSSAVRCFIGEVLGVPPHEIWPGRDRLVRTRSKAREDLKPEVPRTS